MSRVVVTFDLFAADGDDYKTAYAAFAEMELLNIYDHTRLPRSTVTGTPIAMPSAATLSAEIVAHLASRGLKVERLLVSVARGDSSLYVINTED